jgi:hypothetical protein
LKPKQLVTVHYQVLLFAAKLTDRCALKSVVVYSQSNWSLCTTKRCCCLQPK